jgi:oligopeptide/dipeptide ABC transporter ATP-binding protein
LAWVAQDPQQALNPFLRVREHLNLLPAVHLGEPQKDSLARLQPLLERLRLPRDEHFFRRYPHELSGGQRQRLVLAMALSCDPELLVLDEPTTALDPTVQAEFLSLMGELQRERNLGWLWITHDLGVVASVTDRLVVLYGGEPMEAGPTARLIQEPRHPYTQRLLSAAKREPATEAGYLAAPGERPLGCPFRGRCESERASCGNWALWQGTPLDGLRCESKLEPVRLS